MTDIERNGRPAGTVLLSRGEVEALCTKAARGAGMEWGLAEEAGFAASWLSSRGYDGAGLLLRHLASTGGRGYDNLRPYPDGGIWRAKGQGAICPICLGAALLDRASLPDGPFAQGFTTDPVSYPLLALPFLAEAGQRLNRSFAVEIDDMGFDLATGRFDEPSVRALARLEKGRLTVRIAPSEDGTPQVSRQSMVRTSKSDIAGLEAFAMRTTVPATDASRQGAGADGTDND